LRWTATSYENSFYPECELEIGGFKKSFKPFGSNDINLEDTLDSNVKISVDVENKRWGVEYSNENLSVDVPPLGPLTGELGVKVWGEGGTDGLTDYGVQGEAKFGLGVKKQGVGFACYFVTTSVKFNARAFADALRR
jgi:hypothetical protein